MYLDTTYRDSKLYFSVDAQQLQRTAGLAGEVVFHPDHQEIHLPAITLRSQQIEWHTAPGSAAAIQYSKDQINVKDVALESGDQRIVAEGILGGPADQPLTIQAENVDVAQLNQLALGQPGDVSGRLSASATVTGSMDAPRVDGEFTLSQGGFRMFRFDSLGGMVDYDANGVELDVRLQQNPTQWLTAKGHAPTTLFRPTPPEKLDAAATPSPGDAVNIKVESSPIDLSVIQGFTSSVTNVTGTMQANIDVAGSGYDPHLNGAVEIKNGAFDVPDLGTSYTGLDTRIDLTPEALRIAQMNVVDNHACRGETKFDRMSAFATALPGIRARTAADLARPGLPREKVLAAVVQLLEKSLIRVGNEEYARQNHSFGLTTLQDKHVDVRGASLRFEFRGKSGVKHRVAVNDRRLARIVKQCRDLPGQDLFQYIDDDGRRCDVTSGDVNAYLKSITGRNFTAKDFRTWAATVLCATALDELETVESPTKAKKNVMQAIEAVAGVLGNTRAVCRKSYIHPAVMDAYMDGTTLATLRQAVRKRRTTARTALRPEETAVLRLLESRLEKDARRKKAA